MAQQATEVKVKLTREPKVLLRWWDLEQYFRLMRVYLTRGLHVLSSRVPAVGTGGSSVW